MQSFINTFSNSRVVQYTISKNVTCLTAVPTLWLNALMVMAWKINTYRTNTGYPCPLLDKLAMGKLWCENLGTLNHFKLQVAVNIASLPAMIPLESTKIVWM